MSHLEVYGQSLALLTDFYQLTMVYGYWRSGIQDKEAVFHLSFRSHPFNSGFSVCCGLLTAIEFIGRFRFDEDDLAYLSGFKGNDGKPIFEEAFLEYLRGVSLRCDVDAIPEGTVVFPNEPLVRVKGPLAHCQLLETALLNCINFETLIATKAARMFLAAKGDPILEFGLRRAQGPDGGLSASRAAFIGGCSGTSNVLAGKLFGIPVKGTHAHSWVMAFESELEAFERYSEAMPNNCIFLVDTYDTLEGVRRAAEIGVKLRKQGYELAGIRLDSGDLAHLSKEARRILDAAGLEKAVIVASNDLDETIIESLKQQGAAINVWGVGTRLATAYDQPALGGVYKLSAIRDSADGWRYTLKLSEQTAKVSNPGILQVRRFYSAKGTPVADAIYDIGGQLAERGPAPLDIVDPADATRRRSFSEQTRSEDLLIPIFRGGQKVYDPPDCAQGRARTLAQLSSLDDRVKRRLNPEMYPVGLESGLFDLKNRLIAEARGVSGT